MAGLSPMMQQYVDIKNQYKEAILFFRLGDFYEMFFQDAELVSRELNLTLTARDCGQKDKAPMCGIPHHSCESYIARLVAKGFNVVMCDQVEDPSLSKGIVKREVVRVITPGTVIEESMLDESKNNYICSVYIGNDALGVCFCDVSTGELNVSEIEGNDFILQFKNELGRFSPREILIGGNISLLQSLKGFIKEKLSCNIELPDDKTFDLESSTDLIIKHFKCDNLKKLKLEKQPMTIRCLGALFSYLRETQKTGMERINTINIHKSSQYMGLDLNTIRNLELVETMRNKDKKGSLLWVLDKTRTSMGKRLLRSWVERPLMDCEEIHMRQEAISELHSDIIKNDRLSELLSGIYDIERLMTRVVYGTANARDIRSLYSTFLKIPEIKDLLKDCRSKLLSDIYINADDMSDLVTLIDKAIVDEPPFSTKDGGIIKDGYDSEIDSLRNDVDGGKNIISKIEAKEREKTGIPKLKVGYNRVFGYYIEVTNSFKKMIPETYIRKQTLTNCERYITSELKEWEVRVLGARDRVIQLECQAFDAIKKQISDNLVRIEKLASMLSKLDVIRALAEVALKNNYVRPKVNTGNLISLKEGRHPVVELLISGSAFVPNNAILDDASNNIAIITGPNMAGKSTYMRQIALIVLMAQIGSFVPAQSAEIGLVDNIFTRIGASDDLASGQSTFMVEMNEVAQILKNATNRSLLILDEIGRGTSTFDGMSIARAVLEYISDKTKLGAKTLFSTHYHELTVMGEAFEGIKNYNVSVKKRGDDITFLRRIVPGGADDSYGIEVAKLAGVPDWIIVRAKEILAELEKGDYERPQSDKKETLPIYQQNDLLEEENKKKNKIMDKLKTLDVSVLTPIEAINVLFELIKIADN